MKFFNEIIESLNSTRIEPLLLIIFTEFNNSIDDTILDILFSEAIQISSKNKSVYWLRPSPPLRLPKYEKSIVVKPNTLERIFFRYENNNIYSIIIQLCTNEIFKKLITPTALFVNFNLKII